MKAKLEMDLSRNQNQTTTVEALSFISTDLNDCPAPFSLLAVEIAPNSPQSCPEQREHPPLSHYASTYPHHQTRRNPSATLPAREQHILAQNIINCRCRQPSLHLQHPPPRPHIASGLVAAAARTEPPQRDDVENRPFQSSSVSGVPKVRKARYEQNRLGAFHRHEGPPTYPPANLLNSGALPVPSPVFR